MPPGEPRRDRSGAGGRAAGLVDELRRAGHAVIELVERIEPDQWSCVPARGVWSPGKEAEHVADATAYHLWIALQTLGHSVAARPRIERAQLTAQRSQSEVVELLRQRLEQGAALIAGLSEAELQLRVRPPRAGTPALEDMIRRVLIGHIEVHRVQIEGKLKEV